jgi:curved DNA-binding protein CbpA
MSDFPDYYAILGVPKTATAEEIRTAYKKESLRYAAVSLSFTPGLILAVDQDPS